MLTKRQKFEDLAIDVVFREGPHWYFKVNQSELVAGI